MIRAALFAIGFTLAVASSPEAQAQDAATQNALNDIAASQRSQAESARRMEQLHRDQARRADTARINAQRDARSMRRFDR